MVLHSLLILVCLDLSCGSQIGPLAKDVNSLVTVIRSLLCPLMFQLDVNVPPLPFNEQVFLSRFTTTETICVYPCGLGRDGEQLGSVRPFFGNETSHCQTAPLIV